MSEYEVTVRREFAGRPFKARTNGAGSCVYLPTDGRLDAVADSKTNVVLRVPVVGLVQWAKETGDA